MKGGSDSMTLAVVRPEGASEGGTHADTCNVLFHSQVTASKGVGEQRVHSDHDRVLTAVLASGCRQTSEDEVGAASEG